MSGWALFQAVERRRVTAAHVHCVRAAGVERASGDGLEPVRNRSVDDLEVRAVLDQIGQGAEKAIGVRMAPAVEDLLHRAGLDDVAGIRHPDAITGLGNHAEIVSDEEDCKVFRLTQIGEQLQNLRLYGHVEGGCRLVGNQQIGPGRESHRNHYALLHPAAEVEGVGVVDCLGIGKPDCVECIDGLRPRLLLREAEVPANYAVYLVPDREHGVERREGILKHHRDPAAAHRVHPLLAQLEEIISVIPNATACDVSGWLDHAQRGEGRHGFAAAGLPDKTIDFTRLNGKRHAVHRVDGTGVILEMHMEVFDFEDRDAHPRSLLVLGSSTSRIVSPMRLKDSTTRKMDSPAEVTYHGRSTK